MSSNEVAAILAWSQTGSWAAAEGHTTEAVPWGMVTIGQGRVGKVSGDAQPDPSRHPTNIRVHLLGGWSFFILLADPYPGSPSCSDPRNSSPWAPFCSLASQRVQLTGGGRRSMGRVTEESGTPSSTRSPRGCSLAARGPSLPKLLPQFQAPPGSGTPFSAPPHAPAFSALRLPAAP